MANYQGFRRNNFQISAAILIRAKKGARKTGIVFGANLNFKMCDEYLGKLIKAGLLQELPDRFFQTTTEGLRFVEIVKKLNRQFLS